MTIMSVYAVRHGIQCCGLDPMLVLPLSLASKVISWSPTAMPPQQNSGPSRGGPPSGGRIDKGTARGASVSCPPSHRSWARSGPSPEKKLWDCCVQPRRIFLDRSQPGSGGSGPMRAVSAGRPYSGTTPADTPQWALKGCHIVPFKARPLEVEWEGAPIGRPWALTNGYTPPDSLQWSAFWPTPLETLS